MGGSLGTVLGDLARSFPQLAEIVIHRPIAASVAELLLLLPSASDVMLDRHPRIAWWDGCFRFEQHVTQQAQLHACRRYLPAAVVDLFATASCTAVRVEVIGNKTATLMYLQACAACERACPPVGYSVGRDWLDTESDGAPPWSPFIYDTTPKPLRSAWLRTTQDVLRDMMASVPRLLSDLSVVQIVLPNTDIGMFWHATFWMLRADAFRPVTELCFVIESRRTFTLLAHHTRECNHRGPLARGAVCSIDSLCVVIDISALERWKSGYQICFTFLDAVSSAIAPGAAKSLKQI